MVERLLAQDGVDPGFNDNTRGMSWGGLGGGYGAVIKMLLAKDGVDTVSKDYYL